MLTTEHAPGQAAWGWETPNPAAATPSDNLVRLPRAQHDGHGGEQGAPGPLRRAWPALPGVGAGGGAWPRGPGLAGEGRRGSRQKERDKQRRGLCSQDCDVSGNASLDGKGAAGLQG